MRKASICTLGCRVNQYESEAIGEALERGGFTLVPFGQPCDIAIINTCTVTAESDRKSRQYIRRVRSAAPDASVIVTGCFAQVSPESAAALGADAVIGNGEKDRIADIAQELLSGGGTYTVSDINAAPYDSLRVSVPKRARAYIKIEDGCENRCAYCIIPAARGRVRSKAPQAVLEEAETIAAGCCEVILTGIETASYGRDLDGWDLAELVCQVNEVEGISRIALASLDPSVLRQDFVDKIASVSGLLPHFHLSVQSGCTRTLNRMRRKYTAQRVLENMERVRRAIPEVTFSADMIVGFPGETEADFQETVEFCKQAQFLHLHIFPYSIRKGTEAADMPEQIPEAEKRRRAAFLAALQGEIRDRMLDNYITAHRKTPVYVLGEKWEDGVTNGHTQHFIECDIETDTDCTGVILPVYLQGRDGCVLKGSTDALQ